MSWGGWVEWCNIIKIQHGVQSRYHGHYLSNSNPFSPWYKLEAEQIVYLMLNFDLLKFICLSMYIQYKFLFAGRFSFYIHFIYFRYIFHLNTKNGLGLHSGCWTISKPLVIWCCPPMKNSSKVTSPHCK